MRSTFSPPGGRVTRRRNVGLQTSATVYNTLESDLWSVIPQFPILLRSCEQGWSTGDHHDRTAAVEE